MKLLLDRDGILLYQEKYLTEKIEDITEGITWRNDPITMFGKTYPQPRLTAWHGDPGLAYTYSKIQMISPGWTPTLLNIKNKLEADLKIPFNSVLINYYRNGLDHMSYHSDDEKELGPNPTIASISLGATRKFHLKHRFDKNISPLIIELNSGSLLIMKGELQHFWQHKISKSAKIHEPRLNLTYRYIRS